MSLCEFAVVVGRATADSWYAIPLVDPVPPPPPFGLPIHTALGTTRDLALKNLQQRLATAHDLGDPCLQPLRLDQPKLLRFRIDWPRTSASPLPIQVDVVQGFDTDSEEWAAAVPLHGLLVFAERPEELRAAVTFAVLNRVSTERVARITPAEPPELAALRVHFRDRPRGGGDLVPAAVEERCEQLPTTLPSDQRALGREDAALELAQRLLQPPIRLVLVGPRGAGKTTLLRDAVARLRQVFDRRTGERPPRVFRTNAARLIGGARWLGQWQEQCQELIAGIQETGGILATENLADLLTAGGEDPNASVGAFLVPWLARGELPFVTEATVEELDACSRLLPALADLLEPQWLPELSTDALHALLAQVAAAGSPTRRLQIDPEVPATVADLFTRFLPYTPNVQAAPFLRSVVAAVRQGDRQLSATVVRQHFATRTSLPAMLIDDTVPLHRAELQARLAARVIGQPAAVTTVVDLLLTLKAGLHDPARPFGVLLFCGPTGTGKTELARALGDLLFPHRPAADRLVRLDMSEYGLPGAAYRFLGTGGEPAPWLRRLRRDPFAVVLFDEIEKADPEIFDLLLSVFDEGRLVDDLGRQTTLCSTVLVMTSNLGVQRGGSLRFGDAPATDYREAVARFFRPEFGNRISAIVPFAPLPADAIARIAQKELEALNERDGLQRRGLRLQCSQPLVDDLARTGFDPELGARPLQRTIEARVIGALSRWLIEHPDVRDTTLLADLGAGGEVALRVAPPPRRR